MSCVVCKSQKVDKAHIKTRGSGGSSEPWNLIDLCRQHHQLQHSIGFFNLCVKYPDVYKELKQKGWEFKEIFGVIRLIRKD